MVSFRPKADKAILHLGGDWTMGPLVTEGAAIIFKIL